MSVSMPKRVVWMWGLGRPMRDTYAKRGRCTGILFRVDVVLSLEGPSYGHVATWLGGYMDTWIYGSYGYMTKWIYGSMDPWMYGYMAT